MNRTFNRTRMIRSLGAAPWLQEVEEGRLEAFVVNVEAICQSLRQVLIRETDPSRWRYIEEDVPVGVPGGVEYAPGIDPRIPQGRIGTIETLNVVRLAQAVVSSDEDAAARRQVVLQADDHRLPIDGVKDAVQVERHEPWIDVGGVRQADERHGSGRRDHIAMDIESGPGG